MESSLTFTLQNSSGFMSSLLITHCVERAAGAEPGLGTSAIAAFFGGGLSMASKREGPRVKGDRRRVWKLHEAAPVGEGPGAGEARLKLLGDILVQRLEM